VKRRASPVAAKGSAASGASRQQLPGKPCPLRRAAGQTQRKLRLSRLARVLRQGRRGDQPCAEKIQRMQNATYIALSSQMALQRQMDVVANNLANLATPAFKGEAMMFSQYLVKPGGTGPLAFVQDIGTVRDLRQGALSRTGNPLDMALEGKGYFAVQTPLGVRYSRNGHFQLDPEGQIVTSDGFPVLGDSGQPMVVPATTKTITVAPDGTVSLSSDGTTAQSVIGKLQVVDFPAPQAVTPAASGLWVTDQTPQPAAAKVQQGMIEESNVQPVVELTRMLSVARASQSVKNLLDEESQRQSAAIDKLAKVS
jgi:flagellar basal-body rod protein FlgF